MHHSLIRRPRAACLAGVVLALFPLAGFSLGLGKLKVHSALSAPLDAEIEITSITDAERRALNVTLASRSDFEAAGAQRLPFLTDIKFTPIKQPDGRHVLRLTTEQPVDEPFLHLLIQVEWSGGRLVRQYSALIDPPQFVRAPSAAVQAPEASAASPAEELPSAAPESVVLAPEPVAAAEPQTPAAPEPAATPELATAPEPEAVPEPDAVLAPETPPPSLVGADESTRAELPPTDASEPAPAEVATADDASPNVVPMESGVSPETLPETSPVSEVQYETKRYDTLGDIARMVQTDPNVSWEQMTVALYQANRHAFFRGNMNNLSVGKILKIPEPQDVAAIPQAAATRELRAQYDVWQEYKLKLAGARRAVQLADAGEPESPATPPSTEPKPADTQASAKPGDEMLRIVRSDLDAKKTTPDQNVGESASKVAEEHAERGALADRAATLQESLASRELENKAVGEKIGQVRAQLKKQERLIEIESQSVVTPTKQPKPDVATAPSATPPVPQPAAKPVPAPEAAKPAPPPVAATPAPKKRPTPVSPPPAAQPDFLATLIESVTGGVVVPILGGVVILALGVAFVLYWRRRQRSIVEFEESILASDGVSSEPDTTGPLTVNSVSAPSTGLSRASDFSQAGMDHAQTDDVDPIAEAEVYLAYGRDETAEEILKEATTRHPERHEIKQKLLEIYHQRNDVGAFETMAEELYAALGGRGGKSWEKIEEMGRKLSPNNPMFRGGAPGAKAGASPAAPEHRPGKASTVTATVEFDSRAAQPRTEIAQAPVLDIDFDAGGTVSTDAAPTVRPAPASIPGDFDMGLEPVSTAASGVDAIEFEPVSAPAASASPDAPMAVATDSGTVEWESSKPTPAANESHPGNGAADISQWDETATKLDLARAYVDMGDKEGARSILDEVLAEGNETQKKQAADLAAQLG